MRLFYRLAADLVVVVHFAYVAFVVMGLLAILLGAVLRWRWVRSLWFRVLHLLAILVVAAEAVCGITCPLTTWEQDLRTLAGDTAYRGDFIAAWVHDGLFYDAEPWVFTVCYVLFALIVLATFVLAPPRWRGGASS
jgi:polyferredoxin